MGKSLKKHADILNDLHALVTKQANQASFTGEPCKDTKPASPSESTDTINKNEVKPENNKNEFSQEPSKEEAGKVVSKSASVEKAANDILDLLKLHTTKSAEAQESVVGEPGKDTKPAGPEPATDTVAKNEVVPQNNKNEIAQDKSKEEAGKAVSAEGESVKEIPATGKEASMADKIASFNTGANLIRDLLKQSGYAPLATESDLLKQAGARDFEFLINEASAALSKTSSTKPKVEKTAADEAELVKAAEAAGASLFDEIHAAASVKVAADKTLELEAKIAELTEKLAARENKEIKVEAEKTAAEKEAVLAAKIAGIVIEQLKRESAK